MKNYYSEVPENIFNLGLTAYELAVYFYLHRCKNKENYANPSYKEITISCGIGKNTAIETVKRLKEKGLINIEKQYSENGGQLAHKYIILKVINNENSK